MRRALAALLLVAAAGCSQPKPHEAIIVEVDWSQYVETYKPEIDREVDNGMCDTLQGQLKVAQALHPEDYDLHDYIREGIDIAC